MTFNAKELKLIKATIVVLLDMDYIKDGSMKDQYKNLLRKLSNGEP